VSDRDLRLDPCETFENDKRKKALSAGFAQGERYRKRIVRTNEIRDGVLVFQMEGGAENARCCLGSALLTDQRWRVGRYNP
jgi:hypothetical protein